MFARLQTLVVVALATSALAAPTSVNVNGYNNYNSGSLQNGNNVDFSIGGASDISGVYNVGSGNSMNIDHSSISGNTKKVTKVTKTSSHHKRAGTSTTVNGYNNFNSGSLQNGDNVSFGIYDASDVSGVYNVGAGNSMNVAHSSISGNKKVTQKTVKTSGHHKRHGSTTTSTTTVNGDNNFNSGDLQNGNNIGFSIGDASDVSGVYNVGSGNSMNIGHSSVSGNTKVTKVTKVKSASHHKRHSSSAHNTVTVNGSNDFNSGDIQNGNNVDFAIGDASGISGVYNVGSSNSMSVDHSSIAGNSKTKKVTVTKSHH